MQFLIIGASGFIGKHTLQYAKSAGHEVVGTQARSHQPGLVTFDLLCERLWTRIDERFVQSEGPVVGVICAGIGTIDRCFSDQAVSRAINVDGTVSLIEDLQARHVKPVFLSSTSVYDGEAGYYTEDHSHCPLSEYGRQKAEVERFLMKSVREALVLRLDKIVGDDPKENHLFSEWYRWVRAGRPISCIEKQVLSPTFVGDVARAIVLSCELGLTSVYNAGNSEFFTRDELARQFLATLGERGDVECRAQSEFGFREPRPQKSYLDSTRFVRATGMRFTPMREVFAAFKWKLEGSSAELNRIDEC